VQGILGTVAPLYLIVNVTLTNGKYLKNFMKQQVEITGAITKAGMLFLKTKPNHQQIAI